MATDKKITDLPAATLPLAGTEPLEIVQGGVNKQAPASAVGGGGGSVPDASTTTKGIAKLYTGTGSNADGSMDQNSITTALAAKEATANKDATGGYAGLTLFKINFKNALNTFTSFFTNSNTAARTYTFQNRDGTIADDTDLALKLNTSTFTPYILTKSTPSTAGGTITLDMNSTLFAKFLPGSTFATPKTLAMSNTSVGESFNWFFEITNVAAVLTVPADWLLSDTNFDGSTWTPSQTGKYELGGDFDGTNWQVKINGPVL